MTDIRGHALGQERPLTPVDRFGIWLSVRQVAKLAGGLEGKRLCDVGCGFHAEMSRQFLGRAAHVTLADIALSPDLVGRPDVTAVAGTLPESLATIPDGSQDLVVCNSVLEHLWEPGKAVAECHRILAPGGTFLVNVPSWRGKWFLEFSAFRLGLSTPDEMDDHKAYYDPRDLWPLLVAGGFRPRHIRCFTHKFGLNTFAVCRKD